MSAADLSRVLVVGTSCAGKTTFSKRLAAHLAVPHIELDALYWRPGWVPRERGAFRARVAEAIAPERWVIDGNYGTIRKLLWPRATAVIWLNYSFGRVAWRGLRRTLRRALTAEELYSGNRETIRGSFFSRDSILLWIFRSYGGRRRRYRALLSGDLYPNLAAIEFRRPAEAERFLLDLS